MVHLFDDLTVSGRVRAFLRSAARRHEATSEDVIRAEGCAFDDAGQRIAAPVEAIEAMVAFEERYGGLCYRLLVGNDICYGLGGEPEAHLTDHGWAFVGIFDGDHTWPMEVHIDGRIAVDFGKHVEYRFLHHSIDQRLESDALLAEVRTWPHRAFEFSVNRHTPPDLGEVNIPPVPEANGPSGLWWYDGRRAIHCNLHSWLHPSHDRWNLWTFARKPESVSDLAYQHHQAFQRLDVTTSEWCYLCGDALTGRPCLPGPSAEPTT